MNTIEKSNKTRNTILSVIAIAAILVIVYFLDKLIPATSGWKMLVTTIDKGSIYALVAVSMNLLNGFTGLFSLGQAGFMLIGAYTYAIFLIPADKHESVYQYFDGGLIKWSLADIISNAFGGPGTIGGTIGTYIGMFIPMILAGLLAAFIAFLIGIPVLRLKSDYLAIATLGFAEIVRAFFQWNSLGPITNGSNVLKRYAVYKNAIFPVIIAGIGIAIIILLMKSSFGRAFKAIRDDEIAAEAMGVNLFKHKELSFVISSFFAGIGGALLAMFQNTIQASPFTSNMTYEILLVVVIGGIGSITGSVIASYLFIACSEWWLRGLDSGKWLGIEANFMRPGFRKVVFATIIIVIVLFFAKGIMGTNEFSWDKFISRIKNFPHWLVTRPAAIKVAINDGKKKRAMKKALKDDEKRYKETHGTSMLKGNLPFEPLEMPDHIVVFGKEGE